MLFGEKNEISGSIMDRNVTEIQAWNRKIIDNYQIKFAVQISGLTVTGSVSVISANPKKSHLAKLDSEKATALNHNP